MGFRGSSEIIRSDRGFPRISRFFDTVGDGTGSSDGAVDGSVTPVFLKFFPPQPPEFSASGQFQLTSLHIIIRTNGVLQPDKYGSTAELVNGVTLGAFSIADDTQLSNIHDSPIMMNSDWARLGIVELPWSNVMHLHWDINNESVVAAELRRGDSFYIGVAIRDDLTSLLEHRFFVQGYVAHR